MARIAYFQIPDSRIVVAQVLAGAALVLILVDAIAGPQIRRQDTCSTQALQDTWSA